MLMRKQVLQPGETVDDLGEDGGSVYQIVVPVGYWQHVLELAHYNWWSGQLGVAKTYDRTFKYFFWLGMKSDVVYVCKTCHTCQIVEKPNQVVPPAPLHPLNVTVNCVGPLPKIKSGNHFL